MSITYPGPYATPGALQPGAAIPGVPLSTFTPVPPLSAGFVYLGYATLTCLNYTPNNGGSLVLVRGQLYQLNAPSLFQLRGHAYFGRDDFLQV